jgi:hypothetical protein
MQEQNRQQEPALPEAELRRPRALAQYTKMTVLFRARLEAVASYCAEPPGKSEFQCMTVNS